MAVSRHAAPALANNRYAMDIGWSKRLLKAWWVAVALVASAHAAATVAPPAWRAQADAMLAPIPPTGPGASVVVMQGSAVVYEGARGLASVELGTPLTPGSPFRIGSITKTVTAAAILRLAADGRLDIEKPIATWLPTFPGAAHITVRELLNHTAGISDAWEAPLAEVLSTPARLQLISNAKPTFPPGTDWSYSNSGYMVLGALLEKITGKTWDKAEQALVLQPLGLGGIGYQGDLAIVPGMASGYSVAIDGALAKPVLYSIAGPGAAGSLTADAHAVAMLPHQLATACPAIFTAMATPARIGDATLPYGLGMVPGTLRGTPIVEHSGGIDGYTAHYVYVPGRNISVAVLENTDKPTVPARSLARRLAALAMGQPYPAFTPTMWPAQMLTALEGSYEIGDGSRHIVTVEGQTVHIQRSGGPKKVLVTAQGDALYYAGDGTDFIHVVKDHKGKVVAIEFHTDGADEARREKRL